MLKRENFKRISTHKGSPGAVNSERKVKSAIRGTKIGIHH